MMQEVNQDELRRGLLRRVLGTSRVFFEPCPAPANALLAAQLAEERNGPNVHHLVLTLLSGHHMPDGASTFADLFPCPQATLGSLANSIKYLEFSTGKRLPQPAGYRTTAPPTLREAAHNQYYVTAVLECVPSAPMTQLHQTGETAKDPYTGQTVYRTVRETYHVCAGWRVHWLLKELNATAATAVVDEPEAEPGDKPPSQAEMNRRKRVKIQALARENPLAAGLAASFHEKQLLQHKVVEGRKNFKEQLPPNRRNKATHKAAQEAVPDPEHCEQYRFAQFGNMGEFLTGGIQPFFCPVSAMCVDGVLPENDPGSAFMRIHPDNPAGQRWDDLCHPSSGLLATGLPETDYYVSGLSPLHPGNIFSLERGLVYLTHPDSGVLYTPHTKCRLLQSYYPGKTGIPEPESLRRSNAIRAAIRNRPAGAVPPPAEPPPPLYDSDDDDEATAAARAEGLTDVDMDVDIEALFGPQPGGTDEQQQEDFNTLMELASDAQAPMPTAAPATPPATVAAAARTEQEAVSAEEDATDSMLPDDVLDEEQVQPLDRLLNVDGSPFHRRQYECHFPFPRCTWRLPNHATFAEILGSSAFTLPYSIGEKLPPDALQPLDEHFETEGTPMHPALSALPQRVTRTALVDLLQATKRLAEREEALSVVDAYRNMGNAAGDTNPNVGSEISGMADPTLTLAQAEDARVAQEHRQRRRLEDLRNATAATRGFGGDDDDKLPRDVWELLKELPTDLARVYSHQERVVRVGLQSLANRYANREYLELDPHERERDANSTNGQSSDKVMPAWEFLPPKELDRHGKPKQTPQEANRQRVMKIASELKLTTDEERMLMSGVDIFPKWQTDRCEALENRSHWQTVYTSILVRHRRALDAIRHNPQYRGKPKTLKWQLEEEQRAQRLELWGHTLEGCRALRRLWDYTMRASSAWLATRDYSHVHFFRPLPATDPARTAANARSTMMAASTPTPATIAGAPATPATAPTSTTPSTPRSVPTTNGTVPTTTPPPAAAIPRGPPDPRLHIPVKGVHYPMRPYWVVQQRNMDSIRSVELVTKNNYVYAERALTMAPNCMRWIARRLEPALNYTMAGPSGVGKSFILKIIANVLPEGVYKDTAHETTAAYMVDQDCDGDLVIYHEFPSAMLFTSSNTKDSSANDKINFAKARLTDFFTSVKYFFQNPEDGRRTAQYCFSSQHILTMGATNQELAKMDVNMRRRLLMDYVVSTVTDSDGAQPYQQERHIADPVQDAAVAQRERQDQREIFCAMTMVETGIKMGVIPELVNTTAYALMDMVLRQVRIDRSVDISSKGNRNRIMETARLLSIRYACYQALFGPRACRLYELGVIERWSPEMLAFLVLPDLIITKDAVLHALEMLDFLYCTREEDRLLASIALKCCHLDRPDLWRYRKYSGVDDAEDVMLRQDCNYLSFTADTIGQLCKIITERHREYGQYRAEDIRGLLHGYERIKRPTRGLDYYWPPGADMPNYRQLVHLSEDASALDPANAEGREPILIETNHAVKNKKSTAQFCLSIEFIASRFNIDIEHDTPSDMRRKIAEKTEAHVTLDASWFPLDSDKSPEAAVRRAQGMEALRPLSICTDQRAPMVASIRKVLCMPTLDHCPIEHPDLLPFPRELWTYGSFYLPDDIFLKIPRSEAFSSLDEPATTIRIPLDGCFTLLKVHRDPKGRVPTLANYTMPLPTACLSLRYKNPIVQGGTDTAANEATNNMHGLVTGDPLTLPEFSYGYQFDKYDLDWVAADQQMRRIGHPGIPQWHEWFLEACYDQRPAHLRHLDAAEYREQLFDAIPRLDPVVDMPLPFAFPPLAYRLEQYLAKEHYHWVHETNYPLNNLYKRTLATAARELGELSHNANGAFERLSTRYGYTEEDEEMVRERRKRHRNGTPMTNAREEDTDDADGDLVMDLDVAQEQQTPNADAVDDYLVDMERPRKRLRLNDDDSVPTARAPLAEPEEDDAMDIDAAPPLILAVVQRHLALT